MQTRWLCGVVLAVATSLSQAETVEEKRAAVQDMRSEVLAELYQEKPDVKQQIEDAVGYAVFSNANVNVVLASFGGGYGIVRDNRTGADTYLKRGATARRNLGGARYAAQLEATNTG